MNFYLGMIIGEEFLILYLNMSFYEIMWYDYFMISCSMIIFLMISCSMIIFLYEIL
jgi:hypothetical protein